MHHPDILLVGWDDVSQSEADALLCPQLATFRSSAYECGQAISSPVCSQSRQSILFGLFGKRIGTWSDIGTIEPVEGLTPPGTLPTLPSVLAGAGYSTALIGKWHLGPSPSGAHWAMAPIERGYQEARACSRLNLNDYHDWQRFDSSALGFNVEEHETQYATSAHLAAATEWWLSMEGLGPRFMHASLNAPHNPLHRDMPDDLLAGWPRPPLGASNRNMYRALLRTADTAFGELLELVGPDTVVFLYSDNGSPSKVLAANSPWKGKAKETVFDGGIRVLSLGRWGQSQPTGLDPNRLNSLVDLPAGILAAVGVSTNPGWDSKAVGRSWTLSESLVNASGPNGEDVLERLARSKTYALRQSTPTGGEMLEELYDLVADPFETTPLSLDDPDLADTLTFLRQKLIDAAL